MSGGAVAYHLRENKAIERNLFIDLLARVGRVENISEYTYIGFGGPFLEDIKSLHASLRINKMISIEGDENVWQRQKFNKPANFVDLRHSLSGDFIRSFDFSGHYVVWLDYTSPREIYQQLSEFRSLVGRLGRGDVVKITLNGNPQTLGGTPGVELHAERKLEAERRLGDYCPADLQEEDVMASSYPSTLLKAVRKSLREFASRASGEYFQPLSSFVYKDGGHQMLTVTGVVLDAKNGDDKARFFQNTRLDHWPFINADWQPPTEISVPTLSAKERMALDAVLPLNRDEADPGEALASALGYLPSQANEAAHTKLLLANYAKFYRAYPLFSRVVL
jgi:hypothetical protein